MRKISLLTVIMVGIMSLQGQTSFPNGGFEEVWVNKSSAKGNYWDFPTDNFVTTLNKLYDMTADLGIAPLTAFRETSDVNSENYAIKLVSNTMFFGDSIFLPGVLATMYVDIAGMDCMLGKPFTDNPLRLTGFKKYIPVSGDSAAIEIWTLKNGVKLSHGIEIFTATDNDYVKFDIPLTSTGANGLPDSIVVIFASSAGYDFTDINTLMACQGQNGSTLYLDDIAFEYTNGVTEFFNPALKVNFYPNPAKEQIKLSVDKEIDGVVYIYDNLARKVGQVQLESGQTSFDVSNYSTGQYLINIIENGKIITSGRFVKE